MSYTPTPNSRSDTAQISQNLQTAVTAAMVRLFLKSETAWGGLPPLLRLGKKTTTAIRQLLSTPQTWFTPEDKIEYLLESRSLRPYRDYWGLLSGVFPPSRVAVVSDLLSHVQPKLRVMTFWELLRIGASTPVLVAYFDRYFISSWRDKGLELLLQLVDSGQIITTEFGREQMQLVGANLVRNGLDNLRQAMTGSEFVSNFNRGYNKLRAAAQWNPVVAASWLRTAQLMVEDRTDAKAFFVSRALMRARHLVGQRQWSTLWLESIVRLTDDRRQGLYFSAYGSLWKSDRLRLDTVERILTPLELSEAWDVTSFQHYLNEAIEDANRSWHRDPLRRASNLMRFTMFLHAHPRPEIIDAEPYAQVRIRNFLRSYWRQEQLYGSLDAHAPVEVSQAVYQWASRLERFTTCGHW